MKNYYRSSSQLRASLKELQEFGHPVDLAVAEVATVEVDFPIFLPRIVLIEPGVFACQLWLRITNQTGHAIYPVQVIFQDFQGESIDFEPLGMDYGFPIKYRDSLWEQEMLTQVLAGQRKLMPKRPYRGLLVATGVSLPAGIEKGDNLDVFLTMIFSDHTRYTKTISFQLESKPIEKEATKPPTRPLPDQPPVTEEINDLIRRRPRAAGA